MVIHHYTMTFMASYSFLRTLQSDDAPHLMGHYQHTQQKLHLQICMHVCNVRERGCTQLQVLQWYGNLK
ncbi:hypothetical protein GDO86_002241 [Hymenochirus boettgeri]|uniref:Uncharacterized protein n=1 Tax=Hymenochirus boettgeri TaxID=247094 RepID=A0A8T2KIM5_9PIPI|nr:hypothetical protein GDO86_002241 [Hymenochirus boettgeri]